MNCIRGISSVVRLLSLISVLAAVCILWSGCQTFPRGEQIEQLDGDEYPSIEQLHTYYGMCLAAWRVRDEWRDTDWELDYFSHAHTNTLALAVRDGDTLHLIFRSSQAPEHPIDTKINALYRLEPLFFADNTCFKGHRGMQMKYEGIYEEVHRRVREFPGDRITIVGHSAGGMVGILAFFDLYHAYPDHDIRAVTFAPPRVLNQKAADALQDAEHRIIRVVMGRDIIASIPPAFLGYRHVGRLIRMGERPWWKPFSVTDHYPGQQDELERLYEKTQ